MMDLLINVGIFDSPFNKKIVSTRKLPYIDNPFDIFRYTLASISVCSPLINNVYIYVELSDKYKCYESQLREYIHCLFDGKAHYYNYRNLTQSQWQDACGKISSDLIWFLCNHDHFFIDSSLDTLRYCLSVLQADNHKYKTIYASHLPEVLSNFQDTICKYGLLCGSNNASNESFQIVSKQLLLSWWFDTPYHKTFRRPDENGYGVICHHQQIQYIPPKELLVHYDGYNIPNKYPEYIIPPGFFECDIKIRYGYSDRKNECVNINPSIPKYYNSDPNGTDYKWCLEDIPLFWQDRISDIDINHSINNMDLYGYRNAAMLSRLISVKNTICPQKIAHYIQSHDMIFNRYKYSIEHQYV
jgi:hypothetical protein